MERKLQMRARVAAIYQHYCPEKPLSHVDFLLAKYEGYEEDLIDVLEEKYGPVPYGSTVHRDYMRELEQHAGSEHSPNQLKQMLSQFQGMEDALMYELEGRTPLAPTKVQSEAALSPIRLHHPSQPNKGDNFQQCLDLFRQDMDRFAKGQSVSGDHGERQAVATAARTLEQQELLIRSLREELRAVHRRAEESQSVHAEELRQMAVEIAKSKVEILALERNAKPNVAPYSQLLEVESRTSEVDQMLLSALQLQRVYEKIVRTHLALYPVTPVRGKLRELNPTLAARLDTL